MSKTSQFLALIQARGSLTTAEWDALDGAITAWAKRTTDATSPRCADLLRGKQRVVYAFFTWAGKRFQELYDISRMKPTEAWLGMFESVKAQLKVWGVPFR